MVFHCREGFMMKIYLQPKFRKYYKPVSHQPPPQGDVDRNLAVGLVAESIKINTDLAMISKSLNILA